MSGVRLSNVFALEDSFGKGRGSSEKWIAPPPGSYISLSLSRGLNKLYTAGSKTLDTYAYGSISGSWNWSFTLDYNYLEPLQLAFESATSSSEKQIDGSKCYVHTFKKTNEGRVPSFVIRRKQLNKIVDGPTDEMVEARGCVCKSIKFSMQAGSSQINVSMSGVFADMGMVTGTLTKTDYKPYNGELPQFSCMFIGNDYDKDYVADVDSISVDIDNGVSMAYSTCVPVAGKYGESQSNYGFSASVYSTNPAVFKQRMFSGGFDNTKLAPMRKGLKPIPIIKVASYNKEAAGNAMKDAIEGSTRSVIFTITDCAVRSMEWQRGDGSKIMDQMSGTDAKFVELAITNANSTIELTANQVTSADPSSPAAAASNI